MRLLFGTLLALLALAVVVLALLVLAFGRIPGTALLRRRLYSLPLVGAALVLFVASGLTFGPQPAAQSPTPTAVTTNAATQMPTLSASSTATVSSSSSSTSTPAPAPASTVAPNPPVPAPVPTPSTATSTAEPPTTASASPTAPATSTEQTPGAPVPFPTSGPVPPSIDNDVIGGAVCSATSAWWVDDGGHVSIQIQAPAVAEVSVSLLGAGGDPLGDVLTGQVSVGMTGLHLDAPDSVRPADVKAASMAIAGSTSGMCVIPHLH